MSIIENIRELLETGFSLDQIVQLTGYRVEEVKKVENDWREQMKQK